jgi:DNA-binding NarL/FixJ family response regulator
MMAAAKKIRVLIVDDHPMVREMVRLACQQHPRMDVVGEAADGAQALEQCRLLHPDVMVLDLLLPRLHGLDVAGRLRAEGSDVRILILTAVDDKAAVFEALRAGVSGYVEKTAPVEEIVASIVAAAEGTAVFSLEQERQAQEHLREFARRARDTARIMASLTRREREVLLLIAEGLSTKQIAVRLGTSERTAETHISSIYQKLDVRTRIQALYRAAGLGLVNLD